MALALTRDLGVSYKRAFVLRHRLRKAMADELKGRTVGGEGETVEVDGSYSGGYFKPANHRGNRRLAWSGTVKPQCIVIVRIYERLTP